MFLTARKDIPSPPASKGNSYCARSWRYEISRKKTALERIEALRLCLSRKNGSVQEIFTKRQVKMRSDEQILANAADILEKK